MPEAPSLLMLFFLGVNHATHIGDIVVIYTIDNRLNFLQTFKLFAYTLLTHLVNLVLIFLLVRLIVSLSPSHIESVITRSAGGIVALLGFFFLYKRIRERNKNCTHHAHEPAKKNSTLLGIGMLSGFIPCGEVVAIGVLSVSSQIFYNNMAGFLTGLIITLFLLMMMGASIGHTLHHLRHNTWIRLLTPVILILVGLYKLFSP